MKKLNKRKIRWIVREGKKRNMGFYTIAKVQNITPRHARRVSKKYNNCRDPIILRAGRKPKEITDNERNIVIEAYNEIRASATMLEQYLDEKGIHINHNRIHKILLQAKLSKEEDKKKHRRRWVRYERKHSNSLWHTDWFEYKGKQCIFYIDDSSRFISCYGEFSNANTKNSIEVLRQGLKYGIPRQIMSDHGTQFDNHFTKQIEEIGSKHIKARIKHPQSNGKAERAVGTMKHLWNGLGSLDLAVKHYNYKKPHMSLTNGKLRTPYQAFLDKKRKE